MATVRHNGIFLCSRHISTNASRNKQ